MITFLEILATLGYTIIVFIFGAKCGAKVMFYNLKGLLKRRSKQWRE